MTYQKNATPEPLASRHRTDAEMTIAAARLLIARDFDWDTSGDGLFIFPDGNVFYCVSGQKDVEFAPLDCNLDAFELLLTLHMTLSVDELRKRCAARHGITTVDLPFGDDRDAAARRAIVCAATRSF